MGEAGMGLVEAGKGLPARNMGAGKGESDIGRSSSFDPSTPGVRKWDKVYVISSSYAASIKGMLYHTA
jgi:hypothetical protein